MAKVLAITAVPTAAMAVVMATAAPASALPRSCSGYVSAVNQATWNYESWWATFSSFTDPNHKTLNIGVDGVDTWDIIYWSTYYQVEITAVVTDQQYLSMANSFARSVDDADHALNLAESALDACVTGYN